VRECRVFEVRRVRYCWVGCRSGEAVLEAQMAVEMSRCRMEGASWSFKL
jgi:hypothetical protein